MDRQKLITTLALLSAQDAYLRDEALSAVRSLGADHGLDYCGIMNELEGGVSGFDSARLVASLKAARNRQAQAWRGARAAGLPAPRQLTLLPKGLVENLPVGWSLPPGPEWLGSLALAVDALSWLEARAGGRLPASEERLRAEVRRLADSAVADFERACEFALKAERGGEALSGQGTSPDPYKPFADDLANLRDKIAACAADGDFAAAASHPPQMVLPILLDRISKAADSEKAEAMVDMICAWPTKAAAEAMRRLLETGRFRHRVEAALMMRFGVGATTDEVDGWLGKASYDSAAADAAFARKCAERASAILKAWDVRAGGMLGKTLRRPPDESEEPEVVLRECLLRFAAPSEKTMIEELLRRGKTAGQPSKASAGASSGATRVEPATASTSTWGRSEPAAAPPPVPEPSIWSEHVQPFLAENWYMVAGIVMMLAGSSLLAYFTWDKGWLLRYTVLPVLFGALTWFLAWSGSRLERKDRSMSGMAAMMRGAAVSLLPMNFMAVALLSADPAVSPKLVAVPAMLAVYLAVAGAGLVKWCGEVRREMGWLLGLTLLLVNALLVLGPVARSCGLATDEASLRAVIAVGFYVVFGIALASTLRFASSVLTAEMARERTAPWFFGVVLPVTFLQVFAWEHGFLKMLPRPETYSPMLILTGWLVLLSERRAAAMSAETVLRGGESFLGAALIILGLLMGNADPWTRVLCFLLAGVVWLQQATSGRKEIHHWISLTLMALGVGAISLIPGFPEHWRPSMGILAAAGLGVAATVFPRARHPSLNGACKGLQATILPLTAIIAVLAQFRLGGPPLLTAAFVLVVAAMMLLRSLADASPRWLYAASVMLLLALPYLGCMDMAGRRLQGNCMDFGAGVLSFVWLGMALALRRPHVTESRSTVLLLYGVFAAAVVTIRLILEGPVGRDILSDLPVLHLATPLLLMASLCVCAYFSRSLIPSFVAAYLAVVFFFENKPAIQAVAEAMSWGTGLGSASTAVVLAVAAFAVMRLKALSRPGGGDRFFGVIPFPLARMDHTLFTWPLLATGVYLSLKVDFVNGIVRTISGNHSVKSGAAVALTFVFWQLLAVHLRRAALGVAAAWLGWACLMGGVFMLHYKLAVEPRWDFPVLVTLLVAQGCYWGALGAVKGLEWVDSIFLKPSLMFLEWVSLVAICLCSLEMLLDTAPSAIIPAMVFLAIQMVWHGLERRSYIHGTALFIWVAITTLAVSVGGEDALIERLTLDNSLTPLLAVMLGAQLFGLLSEFGAGVRLLLLPLVRPAVWFSVAAAVVGMAMGIHEAFSPAWDWSSTQRLMLLALLALVSRSTDTSIFALGGCVIVYMLAAGPGGSADDLDALRALATPWKLSLLGLILVCMALAGRSLRRRLPTLMAGVGHPALYGISAPRPAGSILFCAAAVFVVMASESWRLLEPSLRCSIQQAGAPFLGAAALVLCALALRAPWMGVVGALLLISGDINAVNVFAGDWLRSVGLSSLYVGSLGFAVSAFVFQCLCLVPACRRFWTPLGILSSSCAGVILVLLPISYFTNPDLSAVSAVKFGASGFLSLAAAWMLRRAARRLLVVHKASVDVLEPAYHFGVAMVIWSFSLMIPWLRRPETAMIALGLPAVYFLLCAEFAKARGLASLKGYAGLRRQHGLRASRVICVQSLIPDDVLPRRRDRHRSLPLQLADPRRRGRGHAAPPCVGRLVVAGRSTEESR